MELAEWLVHWAALKNKHTLMQLSACSLTSGSVPYDIGTQDPNQTSQVQFYLFALKQSSNSQLHNNF